MEDINLKEKALRIIEAIAVQHECEGPCFRVAHAARERTCEHKSWEEEIEKIYKEMV